MKIALIVGHSILKNGNCTSAGGYVQEYAYCKELAPIVKKYLELLGCQVTLIVCPERQFSSDSDEKRYKLNLVNGKGFDAVVELHLNAFNGTAKGTECLYYPTSSKGKKLALQVNDKLDDIFPDRDIKARDNLYILRETDCTAIIVESFFCDNKEDYMKADEPHEKDLIARKIAEGVVGKNLPADPVKPPSTSNGDVLYRICAIAVTGEKAANEQIEKLKKAGFDGAYKIAVK